MYPGDASMSRVSEISNTFFDFGAPPKRQTQATAPDQVSGGDSAYL